MNEGGKTPAKTYGNRGKGRPPGSLNKVTRQVKEMIEAALEKAGGETYLAQQAQDNPVAFMALVGKVLPLQVKAEHEAGPRIARALTWLPPTS